MRDKKDRGNKWLIEHHADSILRLAQVQGSTGWRPRPGEVVVPKALPDGLVEVRFEGQEKADLFLLEVSTYSDKRVEEQLERDVLLVLLDRKVLPEVICLVLHPQGECRIKEKRSSVSRLGHTTLEVRWTVVEMWTVRAQTLLDMNDVGVIPYVPVSQFEEPPEVVFQWCRERIEQHASPDERSSLLAVTWVLAGTRFKD